MMAPDSNDKPLILVTNDDGVSAPGIRALRDALVGLGEIVVVAPDRNQSAVSHMISLHSPLRVLELQPGWMSVDGTPTDCVYLGAVELLDRRPALIVSGINDGPNLGGDVHYSGTVSAAVEGTMLGIPSFALSLVDRGGDFHHAALFARSLAEAILEHGLPDGTTLSVNIPPGRPRGHQLTTSGRRPYAHSVHRRVDPRGQDYFWIGGSPTGADEEVGSDCWAVARGVIAVTPLKTDLTDYSAIDSALGELNVAGWERFSKSS